MSNLLKTPKNKKIIPTKISKHSKSKNITPNMPELDYQKVKMGLLGKVFGDNEHSPINMSGIVIILAFVSLIAFAIIDLNKEGEWKHFDKFSNGMIGIITLTLGYLYGKISNLK